MSQEQSESSESDNASEDSFQLPDALATGREKRQTAGNRLRDMLNAELESEAIFAEDEEDVDFGSDQDQQDDLDSELDSSSEEEGNAAEPEDAGERDLRQREKEAARMRRKKAAEAYNKPKLTNRAASRPAAQVKSSRPNKRPRVSDGRPSSVKRQSSRAHAVEIAADVEKRLVQDASKKAKTSRAPKSEDRVLTQEERLAEAKVTEEMNIASLNKIVKYEEEKKANQKLLAARRRAIGPVIRFVSSSRPRFLGPLDSSDIQKETPQIAAEEIETAQAPSLLHPMDQLPKGNTTNQEIETQMQADLSKLPTQSIMPSYSQYIAFENFAEGEVSIVENARKLLIGGEAKRAAIQYPAKPLCMLSGQPARYRDPETGIYYGNQRAYTMLQEVKTGTVPWNHQLRLYVPKP